MVYVVSPGGQVFEKPRCRHYTITDGHAYIYERKGGRLIEVLPESWWATYNPPYPEPVKMTEAEVIRFVRGCHPVDIATVKRELRKFNARTLLWDDE